MWSEKNRAAVKKRVFDIIQIGNKSDFVSRAFDIFIALMIFLNILAVFLGTFDEMERFAGLLGGIEIVTVAVFIAEYILRIWTAQYLYPEKSYGSAVIHFILSADGLIQLLTILPLFFLTGFVAFRMLRVVRIFRLFRINASYDSFNVIMAVLYEKRNQILSSVFVILILMLASSMTMYSAEHEAQPEVFRNAFSGIWWSVSTLLTVGYGDIYPVTILGRILAIIIAFLGVGAVAIPTGIISAGFVEQYTRMQKADGMEDITLGLQTVVIDMNNAWLGKEFRQIREEYHAQVAFVRRGRERFIPDGEDKICPGDALAVYFGEGKDK